MYSQKLDIKGDNRQNSDNLRGHKAPRHGKWSGADIVAVTAVHSRALNYWLEKRGWTQRELAGRIYSSRQCVNNWCIGRLPIPEYRICMIAAALDITPKEFLAAGKEE